METYLDLYCTTCWIVHPLGIDVYDFHDAGSPSCLWFSDSDPDGGIEQRLGWPLVFAMAGLQVDGKGEA